MRDNHKVKTVLIEDEKKSLLTLQKLLERYCPQIYVAGTAGTVSEGEQVLLEVQPELVFLDIAMPDGDAFDLLERLETIHFEIVFITAYNEFALKAFEFSTLHYILKPINHTDLIEAVNRYEKARSNDHISDRLEVLNQNLKNNYVKISLPTNDGLIILAIDSVTRIEADSNYSEFFLNDRSSVIVSKPLNYFEELLADLNFFRVHNTHLVNLKYVKKYSKGRGGLITLSDGSQIGVSAHRKKEFLQELNKGIYTVR